MKHQLITLEPLERVTQSINGFPAVRWRGDPATWSTPGDNYAYVPIEDRPDTEPDEGFVWSRTLTSEADTWEQVETTSFETPIPSVTRRQLHLALLPLGVTPDSIAGVLAAMPETTPEEVMVKTGARIEYDMATSYDRDNPLVAQIAAQLGMTEAQVDDLFLQAATL